MEAALQIVSIIVSVVLIILVLMQAKGAGLGDLLGGGETGGITRTRRGLEKTLASLPNIEVTVYLLPLQEGSEAASASVWCAPDRQAAWESLMQKGKPLATVKNAKCDTSVFARNRALAARLGIHGTPAIIADDGRLQPGALNRPELISWLTRSSTVMEPIR